MVKGMVKNMLTENALKILEKRYFIKDETGRATEDGDGLFWRVAKAIAEADLRYTDGAAADGGAAAPPKTKVGKRRAAATGSAEAATSSAAVSSAVVSSSAASSAVAETAKVFYQMMSNLEFLPNSPTLMNAGRPLGQLSACFVLPVEDSMEGIFDAIKSAALIHKSGGGTGFSFSRLRPKGAAVNSTGGVASGPVSFMKVFNAATEAVKQGGTRRGANMGILRVDHPDIREFITCKQDNLEINNFNISIAITDAFMQALERGGTYALIDPKTQETVASESAADIFDLLVRSAWQNGEPGVVFIDRMNRDNVIPGCGAIESTNPCGEQPLLPYESCNLGSVNLAAMLRRTDGDASASVSATAAGNVAAAGSAAATGDTSAGYGAFALDESKLKETVRKAVHFLDNVIDVNRYPLDEIAERSRGSRKIGLGVMGWADMLLRLSIPYDSREAALLAERVMHLIQSEAREASIGLAKARGVFPYHEKSIYKELDIALRNATTTTIAPTGTLSILAGASSGIEPLFAISYIRNIMDGQEFVEVNPIFLEIAQTRGFYSEELMRRIAREGSVAHIPEVPEDVRRVFVTAHDIAPEWHVRMQASFQKYTDNAVSKTVNLASDASAEDVRDVFLLAYKTLCKGVTIYRDKSRDAQVLNIGGDGDGDAAKSTAGAPLAVTTPNQRPAVTTPRQRPAVTTGFTEKVLIGCGKLYITVNYDANGICEVFTSTGKAGGCPSQSEATARLVSVALRSGVDPREIIAQLKGIRCPSTIRQPGMKVLSCPDAIARMLEKVLSTQFANAADGTGGAGGGLADGGARVLAALRPLGADGGLEGRPAGGEWGVSAAAPDYAELPSVCPECGSALEHEGGCVICRECGFSKCG